MVNRYLPPQRKSLSPRRNFVWYTPAQRFPTEYEDLTVHQQSSPQHYAFQGWPIRFDDGRDPVIEESTRVRSSDWYGYRDPNQTIQRKYVESTDAVERTLEHLIAGARAAGLTSRMEPRWVAFLGQQLMIYPFVDYGLFLALCYAEREALSDTTTFSIVFTAADHLRHLQDLVHYSFALAEDFPAFSDQGARDAWKHEPGWQGARRAVEHIAACMDWMEIVVATHLCFEPLFGSLAKFECFGRAAAAHGDTVTPMILASWAADGARTERWMCALIQHLLADATHGALNREVIRGWIATWDQHALGAIEAFRPVFEQAAGLSFDQALHQVQARRATLIRELGLDT